MRLSRAPSCCRLRATVCVYQMYVASRIAMSPATTNSGVPRRMVGLPEAIGAELRAKDVGDGHRAISILIMLEKAGDRSRKRESRPVERVHEARLLSLGGAEPDVGAAGLIVREVAARRHFQPGAHSRGPGLEVVSHGRTEPGVASRKQLTRHAETVLEQLG